MLGNPCKRAVCAIAGLSLSGSKPTGSRPLTRPHAAQHFHCHQDLGWDAWRKRILPGPRGCGLPGSERLDGLRECRHNRCQFRLEHGNSTALPMK
jgi:hypothetical protein